jgi:hypothetical protein
LQSAIYKRISIKLRPDPLRRLRVKLDRWFEANGNQVGWALPGPPAQITVRIHRALQKLPHLVSPRVCAVAFRTIFNGWCTRRRFQQRHSLENRCVLGCPAGCEDSIEHYCRCPAVLDILERKLSIRITVQSALAFITFCDKALAVDSLLICSALLNYAIYMATNIYSHSKRAPNKETAYNAMAQILIQSAVGHPQTGKFIDNRWATPLQYNI